MALKQLALKYIPTGLLSPLRTHYYRRQLRRYSLANEPDVLGCKALLSPGDVVLDIGANIGVYTRFCAEFVGANGHVHSLEPVPETFRYLAGNVRALELRNVTCYNLAASDVDKDDARMSMPDYSSGGANIYESRICDEGDIAVRTRRLDSIFDDLSPRLIKCDVEGHELACIMGALKLISRSRPLWVVEVSSVQTFALFASLRYQPFVWKDGQFHIMAPQDRVPNYFFFPDEDQSVRRIT